MRVCLALLALAALTACGVDGKPIRPSLNTTVGVGSHGVHAGTALGVRVGGVRVSTGVGL